MKASVRLGLYGLILAVVFAVTFATAGALVPEQVVENWTTEASTDDHAGEDNTVGDGYGAEGSLLGLGVAQDGYRLTAVIAPAETGTEGELSLSVTGPDARPVTDFEVERGKELHVVTVRADGQHFRHVHPKMDDDGVWSFPWQWRAAGSYRIFADFVPAGTEGGVTLSTSVQVGGDYEPAPATEPATNTSVDGFNVSVEGGLTAGEATQLTMTITRAGEPVTELEPYRGAFGRLVALRDGDLAYLHVDPYGDEPQTGERFGPEIVFEATAPTEGRYLLYLEFQIDGEVHTAPLVIDTVPGSDGAAGEHFDGEDSIQESGTGGEHQEGEGLD